MAKTAFLGLGVMGAPMAGHLVAAGHDVSVWNRSADKARIWADRHKGRRAATLVDAVADVEIVAMCVGDDDDVRAVGLPAIAAMPSGGLLIDHTTASAEVARELAAAGAARGIDVVDAPVSGGQAGAEAGKLTILCGGPEAAVDRARPIMQAYAKAITRLGDAGAGQLAKMVNQICIVGVLQGLAEGVRFAQAAGLEPEALFAAIGQGAAQSWQMDNRAGTMARDEFEFGFAVDWARKDLAIVLDEARRNGTSLPLTALVDQYYADIQAMGGGRWDTSSLIKRLPRR